VQHEMNFRGLPPNCKCYLLHCSKLGTALQWGPGCHNVFMHGYYADHFVLPLPEGHRFPMAKYRLLRDRLAQQLPQVLLQVAPSASDAELVLAHALDYIQAIAAGTLPAAAQREIGFPWSQAMAERARRSVGATIAACRMALREGLAGNLAGGTHHAYADKGSGFCVFNDVAVAARLVQAEGVRGHSAAWRRRCGWR